MRARLAVALSLLAMALAVTWPLPLALARGAVLGHPTGDLADHVQGAWWWGQEVRSGHWPDTTTLTHFPAQLRLWFVDPVGAALALPLWGAGAAVAWDLALLAQVLGTLVVAFLAGRDVSGRRSGGLAAAAVVGGSPYVLGLLHSGLSEYLGLAPLVGACWALLRASGRDPRGRPAPRWMAPLAGALIALSGVQAFYYGAFAGLVALACLPGRDWKERVGPLAQALGVGALLSLPVLWALAGSLAGGGAVTAANAPSWVQGALPATDALTFLRPGRHYFPDTPALGNPGILHVNYLGLAALALAVLGLRRPPADAPRAGRLLGPLVVVGVLALGPVLCLGGRVVDVGGLPVPLPLALLYLPGSPFRMVHHPYRLVAALLPLLGFAAGLGTRTLPRAARWTVPVVLLAEALFVSPAVWPLWTAEARPDHRVAAAPSGALLDWPPDATAANRRYQLAQPGHGRPIPYGVNVFVLEALRGDPLVEDLLGALDDVGERARNRDVPGPPLPPVPRRPGETDLGARGFGAVVLHTEALDEGEAAATRAVLRRHLGGPLAAAGHVEIWSLPR